MDEKHVPKRMEHSGTPAQSSRTPSDSDASTLVSVTAGHQISAVVTGEKKHEKDHMTLKDT